MFNLKKFLLITFCAGVAFYAAAFGSWRASGQPLIGGLIPIPGNFQMMEDGTTNSGFKSFSFQLGGAPADIDEAMEDVDNAMKDVDEAMKEVDSTLKGIDKSLKIKSTGTPQNPSIAQTFKAKGIGTIQTRTESINIYVEPSEDSDIHVKLVEPKLQNERDQLKIVNENGILKITMKDVLRARPKKGDDDDGRTFGIFVQVPSSTKIDHASASGDFIAQKVSFDKLRIETASGDVAVANSILKSSGVQTNNGDVKIVDSNVEVLAVQSSSGDVEVTATNTSPKLAIKTSSGDTKIKLAQNADLIAKFITSNGDGELNGADATAALASGKRFGKGSGVLDVTSSSGDLELTVQ